MFDVGLLELVVIAIVILLVLGPNELATSMRSLGRLVYKIREFTSKIWTDIDIMMCQDEYKKLQKQLSLDEEEIKEDDNEEKKPK